MHIQKIFRAGNSHVVAIPQEILRVAGLKPGQRVSIDTEGAGRKIIIKKAEKETKKIKSATNKAFEAWYQTFINENGEILDELAVR